MASTILIKSRQTDATGPAATNLKVGELAVNTFDGRVYLGTDLSGASSRAAGGAATASTIVGAPVLDQDNLSSDSASSLATQQSIKAYVDANAGTGDITGVTAGDGLSGGGASGAVSLALDLNELGTETSIDQADFIAMVDATDSGSEKITFSNLEDTMFGNVSGDATVAAGGALTIAATSVENGMLAGSIANAKLANDSVSYGGVSLDLGATDATPAFDLQDATNYPTSSLTGTITNAQLAGSIAISKLAANDVTIAADSGTAHAIDLGETLTINGTANEVNTAISNNTLTIGLPDNVTIAGNLTVSGSTTTVNSTTVSIADPVFELGASGSDDNLDRGLKMKYNSGGAKIAFIGLDDSTGKFTMIPDATDSSSTFSGTAGTLVMTTFEGALSGNASGSSGSCTGNAATATALAASVTINGTAFDGSGNIVLGNTSVTNAMLAGSITNAKLSNSTISGVALGSNLNALTVDDSSISLNSGTTFNGSAARTMQIKAGGVTNAMLAGSIANSNLANSAITIAGASTALGSSVSAATIAAAIDSEAMTISNSIIQGGAYST